VGFTIIRRFVCDSGPSMCIPSILVCMFGS
jgi:hypothetical protein